MKYFMMCISLCSICAGFSGCVVKEEYPHHHHDRVYIEEERPVVREEVLVH